MKLFWCCFDIYYTCNPVINNVVYINIHNGMNFTDLKTNKQMNTNRKCCLAQTSTMLVTICKINIPGWNWKRCKAKQWNVLFAQKQPSHANYKAYKKQIHTGFHEHSAFGTYKLPPPKKAVTTRMLYQQSNAELCRNLWVELIFYKCFSPSLEWCLHSL